MSVRTRSHLLVASSLLALLTSGCTGESAAGRASSSGEPSVAPVALRIATNDGPDTPAGATIAAYAQAVDDLSDGALRIEPAWEAAGAAPDDWDQAVARTVIDGENALGLVPARAFDVLGAHTLQALQTPFLVTSAQRVEKVVRSPLSDDLMAGLGDLGLTGLGLYPEDLRRIFSYTQPLTRPADLDGSTIRAPRSDMTAAVFAAVGARVDDPSGDAWSAAVASGELNGVESSFAQMAMLGAEHLTTTAGNIVLFPKVNVLVVNREAFEGLENDQRALLREAALLTANRPELTPNETEAASDFCAAGGRIVEASRADVSALAAAMANSEPPHDPSASRSLAKEIEDLVRGLPATETVPGCSDLGEAPASTPPSQGDALLTVDTQIGSPSVASPVVASSSAFRTCTTVRDLDGTVDDSDAAVIRFTGTKRISCTDGEVTIRYRARMQTSDFGTTSGTWWITESTLLSAQTGRGRLAGDAGSCERLDGVDECVRDTYTGTVHR